jgi:cation:H+ antiporter
LTIGIVCYVFISFYLARKVGLPEVEAEFAGEIGDPQEAKLTPPAKLAGLIFIGLILLVVGAKFFQIGGVGIAKSLGVSDAVIALTLLAFGTSLPELATSVVASRKGEGDIIAGNAVGSSVFNVLAILGITVLVKPMIITQIQPIDLAVMVGSAVVGVFLMATRKRLSRTEGGIMLAAYIAYVVMLVMRGDLPAA